MRAHFKETTAIRRAVIRGSISETVSPASALGEMKELGTIQPKWKPAIDALKASAQRFGQSPDVPAAAAAVADMGVACGKCHTAAGGPKLTVGAAPEAGTTVESRMKRHAWANDRLWEGLFGPSDAAWKAGVDALGGGPFPKEVLAKGGVHGRSAATRFEKLVATAGEKKSAEDRAKLYASLLETCSGCHGATGAKAK
jgi:cytochrome c553